MTWYFVILNTEIKQEKFAKNEIKRTQVKAQVLLFQPSYSQH
jgi:hypothetical protein